MNILYKGKKWELKTIRKKNAEGKNGKIARGIVAIAGDGETIDLGEWTEERRK